MAMTVDKASLNLANCALATAEGGGIRTGRPPIGVQVGGRQAIIMGMQKFMRSHPHTNVQRLQIAEFAGVTPALISYYFPEKLDLIIASAGPLISTYIDRIRGILDDDADLLDRFRTIGHEFIGFNFQSGYALDYYIDATMRRKRGDEIAAMSEQYTDLFSFMKKIIEERAVRAIEPAFLHSSLWSQCKYLGRQPHLLSIENQGEAEILIKNLSDDTFRLFTMGFIG